MSSRARPTAREGGDGSANGAPRGISPLRTGRLGRYVAVLAIAIILIAALVTVLRQPHGVSGIPPGQRLPPFAVPLAASDLQGDANVATHAHEGSAGSVPACSVRGARVLDLCQLYERGPLVLALFVDGGSCPRVLSEMQRLTGSFPGVQFAAVSIEGERSALRSLIRSRGIRFPLGIDADGVLAALYKVVSCPQVSFAYPGGIVQSRAMQLAPSLAQLRERVAQLVAASRRRGWRSDTAPAGAGAAS